MPGSGASERGGFDIVVATDGSAQARAALALVAAFPWPERARAHAVVARRGFAGVQVAAEWPVSVWDALDTGLARVRDAARRRLARRFPDAEALVVDQPPVPAILAEARRVDAKVVVVGSRGHGALGRLVMGSVSRGIVRSAPCPVLVVKGRARRVRRLVIGLDGSPNSRRAVAFVERLAAPAGGRVRLVRVVEPMRVPSMGLVPGSIRADISGQAEELAAQRVQAARRELETAAGPLARAGWSVRREVRLGVPLPELLAAVTAARAHVLVLGARGVGGVARLLLGSVAEGALGRASVPVLVVR
jgi:nucleotide-binding universal stress UspA family protein